MLWSKDSESVENSHELGFGHMAILGDIKVLEHWLQVDSHGLHSMSVLIQDLVNLRAKSWVRSQILSPCKEGVVLGDSGDLSGRCLVNSLDGESFVDVVHELSVPEESLWVVAAVLVGERLELVVGEVVIELGEN